MMIHENTRRNYSSGIREFREKRNRLEICFRAAPLSEVEKYTKLVAGHPAILRTRIRKLKADHTHLEITPVNEVDIELLSEEIQSMIGDKFKVRIY